MLDDRLPITGSLQDQQAALMRLVAADPDISTVTEAMKQFELPTYAIFFEEQQPTHYAAGANE